MSIDAERLVKVFVKMRDRRAELKRAWEAEDAEIKAKQEQIEAVLLDHLNKNNQDSVRTGEGTFYRQKKTIPNASDWEAFYAWIKENDAFDALERRIKAKFITDYMEEHADDPDNNLPPGVSVFTRYDVRVRKS
jgi:hypothetical protein